MKSYLEATEKHIKKVVEGKQLEEIFRESLVIELAWNEKIDYIIDNLIREQDFKKISFFKIVKKYLSKKFRTFVRFK